MDIIRGRLGGKFEASKIPTGKSMDKDDMIISLLSSLTEDMDSIKRRINRDNNVHFVNDISASSYEKVRKELVEIRDYLKSMDEKDAGNINVENILRICNRYIHMPKKYVYGFTRRCYRFYKRYENNFMIIKEVRCNE